MSHLTVSGKTIEEAVEKAAAELQITKERLTYRVIQHPKRGFLGIGSQSAMIEAQMLPDPVELARTFLEKTVSFMGLYPNIDETHDQQRVLFEFTNDEQLGKLIGKRGQTLQSLEYLTNLVINRSNETPHVRVELDAENYRERRKQTLEQLAHRVAGKVKATQTYVPLEPMDARERKIIHTALQDVQGVKTASEGSGYKRHIIVSPQ